MYEYLELLLHIAKKKGLYGSLNSSTLKISKELSVSQQTISRKLREMEDNGLIKRIASPNGLSVNIAENGRALLQEHYKDLNQVFGARIKEIIGIVEKGIGEGSYYVSQEQYQRQFKEKIGFNAFTGTLNLKVDKEELAQFLANKDIIEISGFNTKTRSFGALTCYKIKINEIEAAIVKPERARHPEDIIEIIATVNLRSSLNVKDGDRIKIK